MDPERIRQLEEIDRKHVWHPFTQMKGWIEDKPLIVERAEGNWLVDVEGRRYLDAISSLWVTVHGHRVPEIDAAVRAQLDRVAHSTLLGLANVPSIELAERLVRIAPPGLTRVFYSDSGSTAVEVALKIAYQFWQQQPGGSTKNRFVCFENAYHGDTLGSVSVGGIDLFHQVYRPLLFETLRVPSPYCYRCPLGKSHPSCETACLEPLESMLRERADEIVAVVIEPAVQGAAGMLVQPPGFLRRVRELCDRHAVLLIADEVATGFGRTGTMFACEREGVAPDLLCIAKGITGGYLPLAATLATEKVFAGFLAEFREKRTFFHGHTYTGNPLACAAAIANVDLLEKTGLIGTIDEKAALLGAALASLAEHPCVGEIRQRGLMVGIELVRDRATRAEFEYGDRVGHQVILAARRRGVILRPLGDVLVLMPPLAITPDEIALLARVVRESIDEVLPAPT
ncbi:MAG: adenosylmethionine--8-amino-7-oxononanoate transaminase [bacterium]